MSTAAHFTEAQLGVERDSSYEKAPHKTSEPQVSRKTVRSKMQLPSTMANRFKYKNCHNVFVKYEKELVGMSDKEKEKLKLLHELIKGARRSDRELAKVLKISQPTITRKRTRLEAEGLIQEYTIIPNVAKMGFEIVAFTFMSFNETTPELLEKAQAMEQETIKHCFRLRWRRNKYEQYIHLFPHELR